MNFVIDIILLAIFAFVVVAAAKKGFAKSLLEVFAVFLAFALAYAMSASVTQTVYDNIVEKAVVSSVEKQLDGQELDAVGTAQGVKDILKSIPEPIVRLSESFGVDIDKIAESIDINSLGKNITVEKLVEKVAKPVIIPILTLFVFTALSIVLLIILRIIAGLVAKVFKLPLISSVNALLGAILGAVKGVAIVIIACLIVKALFGGTDGALGEMVDNSVIVREVSNALLSLK